MGYVKRKNADQVYIRATKLTKNKKKKEQERNNQIESYREPEETKSNQTRIPLK